MKTETYSEKKTNIKKRVNKRDETEIIEALVWILELDEPELKIIVDAAEEQGLHLLFKSFNGLELTSETKDKISALKNILEMLDGDLAYMDFSDEGSGA